MKAFRLIFGYTVLAAWASSMVLDFANSDYDPNPSLHVLMMLVAGAVFGPDIWERRDRRNGRKREDA